MKTNDYDIFHERYPHEIARGRNSIIFAISSTTVKKIFPFNSRASFSDELVNLNFANSINDLAVKFIDIELDNSIIMERLYPLEYKAFEYEERKVFLDKFIYQLEELHIKGIVHQAINKKYLDAKDCYSSIILTQTGLRLIDFGISSLRSNYPDSIFNKYVEEENEEIKKFCDVFLK